MVSPPSGVVTVTTTGSRSPDMREERACCRTGVVGRSRTKVRLLPLGKVNLSLSSETTTLTGKGAEERTDMGMGAVREVKVTVRLGRE